MLFALQTPIAFVGFLLAFALAVIVRGMAQRIAIRALGLGFQRTPIGPRRDDFDVFGVVCCLIGGMGWGRGIEVDELQTYRNRGRAAIVYASGLLSVLLLSQLVFLVFALAFPAYSMILEVASPADVRFGFGVTGAGAAGIAAELVAALGVGLFCFALFDLIPLPPLDGWGLLWCALRRPGPAAQNARVWLVEKNLGVVFLFVVLIFPFSTPMALILIDLIGAPLVGAWAW